MTGKYGDSSATQGLMTQPPQVIPLEIEKVDPLLTAGGTLLGTTNKGDPFAFPMPDGSLCDRSEEIIAGYRDLNLEAVIVLVVM
jgi:6-phosphofructokinase 1